jgi:hypothetical protein
MAGNGEVMKIGLFLAGDYMFPYKDSSTDIYLLGYSRLLSYDYQKKLVDKLIERKKKLELYLAGTDKFGDLERRKALDLYLAGSYAESTETMEQVVPSNVLFSYENLQINDPKGLDITHMFGSKLFIDSGAFSMWTKGSQVNVDEYIDWINERSDYIDLYGQVDAIPGERNGGIPTQQQVKEAAEKTWENYLYMRPKMNKPEGLLYTFHVGEPKEFLERALEWTDENGNPIPYIALGGMVGKSTEVRRRFLDMCFNIIEKSPNPNVKVHAFGMTSRDLLGEYPITSADSTSWIMTAATGGIMTDLGTITVSSNQCANPDHFSHLPADLRQDFENRVCEFGFTLEELANERNKRIVHNARYMKDRISKIVYNPKGRKKSLF